MVTSPSIKTAGEPPVRCAGTSGSPLVGKTLVLEEERWRPPWQENVRGSAVQAGVG
jgi:hypothetical protein